jgi:hypothetical protein
LAWLNVMDVTHKKKDVEMEIELLGWICYLVNSFPSCTAPFPWTMYLMCVWILKKNSGIKWNRWDMSQTLPRYLKNISQVK